MEQGIRQAGRHTGFRETVGQGRVRYIRNEIAGAGGAAAAGAPLPPARRGGQGRGALLLSSATANATVVLC